MPGVRRVRTHRQRRRRELHIGPHIRGVLHTDVRHRIGGYLEDMIAEALDEAENEAVRMLDRLKADFLQ